MLLILNPSLKNGDNIKIIVRCPRCGNEQATASVKTVRCHRCSSRFEVYLLDSKGRVRGSRVVKLLSGSLIELHEKALREKIKRGRFR